MDFIDMVPIAARLQAPLRAALRGERAVWPSPLTDEEIHSLVVHGVAPLVYATARVPQLRTEAIRAASLEALRGEDVRTVLSALARARVDALVVKGTALAYDLYPSPDFRPRGDTDLLIAEGQIELARKTLGELGFEEHPSPGDEHGSRQTVFTRVAAPGVVHMYDVHWAVANTPLFASALRFDDVRSRARPLPRLGPDARGLGDADALLLACIHRVAHHHDSDRVVWLLDIALLRERMSRAEHEQFWRSAAAARVVSACLQSVLRAEEWLQTDAPGPDTWLSPDELARDEASRVFLDRRATRGTVMLANLRALPWRARLQRLWQVAFPPPSFMQQSFGTSSRFALPWLYLRRGVRGVLRLFRRVGA